MKSLRLNGERKLFFLDLPKPELQGPDEVLVKMRYASICGYDMMMVAGKAALPQDGVMGHEGAGIVEAVGSNVDPRDVAVGDHVTINPYVICGQCAACRSNHPEFCFEPGFGGALMSEYLLMDKAQVFKLPKALSLRAGSLIEPLMMAMHAVEKARPQFGQSLLIIGGGAMGQLILKVARTHPYGTIVLEGHIAPEEVITAVFPFDQAIEAFREKAGGMHAKVMLEI